MTTDQDPRNWKMGIFYFNPDDPRSFVPKQVGGLGWTMNFARPNSIILAGGILTFIIISVVYTFIR